MWSEKEKPARADPVATTRSATTWSPVRRLVTVVSTM
jgi:hypothetical protein